MDRHIQAVLKREDWTLTQEVHALGDEVAPVAFDTGATRRVCWDLTDLPWRTLEKTVCVVRSAETTAVRRQLTKRIEETTTSWM